jgi:hypothetical protein
MTWPIAMIAVLTTILISLPERAHADAIDGHWCQKDGRRMSIEGSNIVTPGGTSMEGEYERHGFAYMAPAGEPNAESRISMAMQSEDIVWVFIPGKGPRPNPPVIEEWQRCDLTM